MRNARKRYSLEAIKSLKRSGLSAETIRNTCYLEDGWLEEIKTIKPINTRQLRIDIKSHRAVTPNDVCKEMHSHYGTKRLNEKLKEPLNWCIKTCGRAMTEDIATIINTIEQHFGIRCDRSRLLIYSGETPPNSITVFIEEATD